MRNSHHYFSPLLGDVTNKESLNSLLSDTTACLAVHGCTVSVISVTTIIYKLSVYSCIHCYLCIHCFILSCFLITLLIGSFFSKIEVLNHATYEEVLGNIYFA